MTTEHYVLLCRLNGRLCVYISIYLHADLQWLLQHRRHLRTWEAVTTIDPLQVYRNLLQIHGKRIPSLWEFTSVSVVGFDVLDVIFSSLNVALSERKILNISDHKDCGGRAVRSAGHFLQLLPAGIVL